VAAAADRERRAVRVLGNYILRTVFAYTALVTMVLMALGALFLFIGEQGDIGKGGYTASQAMMYVLLSLPGYLFQMLPVAALIGTLLGLGNLARGSELVVMRASGITTVQFCRWLGLAGLLLALLMFVVGEYVGPPLGKLARQMKIFSQHSELSFAGDGGTWVRDGDTIISVDEQSASASYSGVQLFRFGPGRKLLSVGRAATASVGDDSKWRLQNFAETTFSDAGTAATRQPDRAVNSSVSPEFLGLAVISPDAMGLRGLLAYVEHLRGNGLDARRYETAFWSRVARIAALVIVVMLALPFAIRPMRAAGQGFYTVVGILIGAAFVLLSQTLESGGQLFAMPPWLIGWIPTALLAALTGTLLWRTR
jgi:lipopolysaccharide export system permease protein